MASVARSTDPTPTKASDAPAASQIDDLSKYTWITDHARHTFERLRLPIRQIHVTFTCSTGIDFFIQGLNIMHNPSEFLSQTCTNNFASCLSRTFRIMVSLQKFRHVPLTPLSLISIRQVVLLDLSSNFFVYEAHPLQGTVSLYMFQA